MSDLGEAFGFQIESIELPAEDHCPTCGQVVVRESVSLNRSDSLEEQAVKLMAVGLGRWCQTRDALHPDRG